MLDAAKSSSSGIPIIGEIIGVVIDGVRIGLQSITKAVDALLAPVTAIMKSVGAALAVASQIIGTISPWTISIDLNPTINRFGVGAEIVTGEISVVAGGWDRLDFPPIVQECASLAGLQLPEPTSKDSPATISVRQDRLLITLDATDLRLDDSGKATTTYVTATEPPKQAKGTEVFGVAWIHTTVERDDLKRLRDDLMNILFSQLPEFITNIVRPIIGPAANQFTNGIITMLNVSRERMLIVVFHETPMNPTVAPGDEVNKSNCVAGTYMAADPIVLLRAVFPGPANITYEGNIFWTFATDGSVTSNFEGFVVYIGGGTAAQMSFSYAGSATGNYVAENGVITVTLSNSTVTMNADMIGIEGVVGGETEESVASGTYKCGGSIVFTIDLGDAGTIGLELIPAS